MRAGEPGTVSRVLARLVVVLVAVLVGTAGCGDAEEEAVDPGYTAERRAEFLQACSQARDAAVCQCTWDRMEAEVPAERFVEVSDGVAAGEPLPDDLAAMASECATDALLGDQ